MSFSYKYHALTLLFVAFSFSIAHAQQAVGLSGGVNFARFFDYTNDEDYESHYPINAGSSYSIFYETTADSIHAFRIELQYNIQNADLTVSQFTGMESSYKDLRYTFRQVNLHLMYSFPLGDWDSFKIDYLFGLNLAYTTNTKAEGDGWWHPSKVPLAGKNWIKNENNSKDIVKFNLGFDLELDFIFPISNSMDVFVNPRYTLFFLDALRIGLPYTSLMSAQLNLGLRYNFLTK